MSFCLLGFVFCFLPVSQILFFVIFFLFLSFWNWHIGAQVPGES